MIETRYSRSPRTRARQSLPGTLPQRRTRSRLAPAVLVLYLAAWLPVSSLWAAEDDVDEPAALPAIEVLAFDFGFQAPEQWPSGWVSVTMKNAGTQEHFVSIYRLPPDKDYAAFQEELLGAFGKVWGDYASGVSNREEAWKAVLTDLPEWWYQETVHVGGPALTEGGESATTTLQLEPGTYVMECYVKTPEGTWHTELGMMKSFSVVPAANHAGPPQADVHLRVQNYSISVDGEFQPGKQVVAVTAVDRPEGFAKHDINLFRLDGNEDLAGIIEWSDWMDLDQFRAPAPGYSLGGMDAQDPGRTGYVWLDLSPGRYAWVSEEYGDRGVVYEFVIK